MHCLIINQIACTIFEYWSDYKIYGFKGIGLASRLRKYNPADKQSRKLAQHMELEVLASPLQLTAWGLLDIDLYLLPSVISLNIHPLHFKRLNLLIITFIIQLAGSCLTYIIILFQFRTGEDWARPANIEHNMYSIFNTISTQFIQNSDTTYLL